MTRSTTTRIAIALLGALAGLQTLPLHADDRKDIIGVWKGGMPGDPPGSIELTITPTKISGRNPRNGKSLGEGTYEIDPKKKLIDAHGLESPVRGRLYVGLYKLKGDTLKWASNSNRKRRPVDLAHRPDRDQFLMVLQRQR